MKIAIHSSKISYSEMWIDYCKEKNIPFKIVNCYDSDIIQQLSDCEILMWHYHHKNSKDALFARQLLNAVEASGKIVYPNFNSGWHFDDKVGQKYLLEAIGAPLVPSYVFYSKSDAIRWVRQTNYPKVFKLRRGSGSATVKLVKTQKQAVKLVNKAFGKGFRQYDPWNGLKERWRMFKLGKSSIIDLLEGIGRFMIKTNFEKTVGKEKGYVYFQDFIEGCTFDIRFTIIGQLCYVFKRLVRENDFRASGSHSEVHSKEGIPIEIIEKAFEISNELGLQSVAFDFLLTKDNKPLITEISYAFGWDDGDCWGYWDSNLKWFEGDFNPFGCMIESLIRSAESQEPRDKGSAS